MDKTFDLIINVVNRGHSDHVVAVSREAGARGATIMYGRGMGVHERDSFLGVSLQPEKEIIMILTPHENKNTIMQSVCEKASLEEPGNGICFSIPVTEIRGMSSKDEPEPAAEDNSEK